MSLYPMCFYCPSCSHISELDTECLTCCPDRKPEVVTRETAEQAKAGFAAMYQSKPLVGSVELFANEAFTNDDLQVAIDKATKTLALCDPNRNDLLVATKAHYKALLAVQLKRAES